MSHKSSPRRLVPFQLRLPAELRAELEQAARADGRSLSNMIVHALHQWADDYENRTVRTDNHARKD